MIFSSFLKLIIPLTGKYSSCWIFIIFWIKGSSDTSHLFSRSISKSFDDLFYVRNDPKKSFEVIFLNFKRHFHIRAETEYEPFLYKLFDLKWVLSSRVSRWRCRIISCYENHVIYFALFQCEIVVFPIWGPFSTKRSFFLSHLTLWWYPELSRRTR